MSKQHRLSSDALLHFTKIEGLRGILSEGFRFTANIEELPKFNTKQINYLISFCDVLPKDCRSHFHFGKNAIVLKKSWGIINKITPVTYIHEHSPTDSTEYYRLKTLLYNLIETVGPGDYPGFRYLQNIMLVHDAMHDSGVWEKIYPGMGIENVGILLENHKFHDVMRDIRESYQKMAVSLKDLKKEDSDTLAGLINNSGILVHQLFKN